MKDLKTRALLAKRALFNKMYENLNREQREAVYSVNGPLLILAGAGSGKTTVLVNRIAHIIKYGDAYFDDYLPDGIDEAYVSELEAALSLSHEEIEETLTQFSSKPCPPWRMLAFTFTNKAAGEIKARLSTMFGSDDVAKDIVTGTFHAVCMRILRTHYELAGYRKNFGIYDADDSKKLVTAVMKELNIDDKMMPVKSVLSSISAAKEKLQTPDLFESEIAAGDHKEQKKAQIYRRYQERLKEANALDFDDIIMQTVFLLRDNKEVGDYYRNRYLYVSVDEYQDTNKAQFVLVQLLSAKHRNLMVVGDDDQSIYKFRGATIENILNFDKCFDNTKIIKLEQNYRSTKNILDAANSVIANNKGRHEKTLRTVKPEGDRVYVYNTGNQNEEAMCITSIISGLVAKKQFKYHDFAVLYRANAQSGTIEKALARSGMPYRIYGGLRFYDRKEIKDIVAYLQLINNHDDTNRMMRIINEPKRKLGQRTLDGVMQISGEVGCTPFKVMEDADSYIALARSASTLKAFAAMINELSAKAGEIPLDELINEVAERSGYMQMLIDGGDEEAERIDNIKELISSAVEYKESTEAPTLSEFLEEIALVSDIDKYDGDADAVVLMTVHSSKGMEFPIVFLPGFEEGLFPSEHSLQSEADTEEERRLAYVAITRAKRALFIFVTEERIMYGMAKHNEPSRFLREIPDELKMESGFAAKVKNPQRTKYYSEKPKSNDKITIGTTAGTDKKSPSAPRPALEMLAPGTKVTHPIFGEGEILSAKPMGGDILYEVMFENAGTKKLLAAYAKLKKVE